MNDPLTLLDDLKDAHQEMLALTNALDWDHLTETWESLSPKIAALGEFPLDHLSGEERLRAAQKIAELIECEKQISARVTPWMEQVHPLLEVFRKHPIENKA